MEAGDEPITIIGYLDDLEEEPLPDLVRECQGLTLGFGGFL